MEPQRTTPRHQTPCRICHSQDTVTSVTLAGEFVYLRCANCAHVWAIPERRALPRPEDAGKIFK